MRKTSPRVLQRNDANPEGILYYVRLKTQFGMIYKLGFTSLESVHERLAYQRKGHERLIDAVLFSARFDNALVLEQCLHDHYDSKVLFPVPDRDMPLYENGQSEVYAEDILGLDVTYTEERAKTVLFAIQTWRLRRLGKTESEIAARAEEYADRDRFMRDLDASIGWAFRLYKRFCDWLHGRRDVRPTAVGETTAFDVNAILALIKEITQSYERTEAAICAAIAALKAKDVENFERLVSTQQFSYNLTSALRRLYWPNVCQLSGWKPRVTETGFDTASLFNCSLSSYEGVFPPVLRTYENLLLEYVKNHTVAGDDIVLPEERIPGHEVLNEHFSPRIFFNIIGKHWSFLDSPAFTRDTWSSRGKFGRTSFQVSVCNERNNVTTTVRIRCLVQVGKLCVNFPEIGDILSSLDARATVVCLRPAVGQRCTSSLSSPS